MNATEQEEREYLEEIKEKLTLAIRRVDEAVRQFSDELRQKKEYIHEHQSGMDDADMVAAGQSIDRMAFTGEAAVARKRKLLKLGQSPYFGRIDFVAPGPGDHAGVHRRVFLSGRAAAPGPHLRLAGARSRPCSTTSSWAMPPTPRPPA